MLKRLSIANFRALRGTHEHELPAGVIALLGANEHGKTSTCLAIAFALYGSKAMPRGISAEHLVNDGAKEASVSLVFDYNGDEYTLTRTQKRSGLGDASLSRNGTEIAKGRDPVTKEVTDLLGVDHEGFMVSVFARQDELDSLAGKQGADRVNTILRLMGVEQVDRALKDLRKQANEARRELDLARAGLGDVPALKRARDGAQAECARLSAERTEREAQLAQVQQHVTALREQQAALGPAREAYSAWQQQVQDAVIAVRVVQEALDAAQARAQVPVPEPAPLVLLDVPEVDDAEVARLQALYDDARQQWSDANAKMEAAKADLLSLGDTECPTCHRPYEDAASIEAIREEKTKALADAMAPVAVIRAAGEQVAMNLTDLKNWQKKRDDALRENERRQQAHSHEIAQHERAQHEHEQARADVARLTQEHTNAEAALASLQEEAPPDPSADATHLEAELFAAQRQESIHTGALATITAGITSKEADIARIERELARVREREQQAYEHEQRVVTLDVSVREMGAMKEKLIAGIVPALEERASAIVDELTDGKHTQLRLSSDYEIQYVTESGELRSFANLSGGAQRIFALSLRLAIADLRAGQWRLLVLDEVMESLDVERQALAWEMMNHLTKRYDQVVLVSHTALIRDLAPHVIAL